MHDATRTPAVSAAIRGALATLIGIVVSGPISLALVSLRPQPAWTGPDAFARAYHPLQTLPYFTGFLLVGGAACSNSRKPYAAKARCGG
jgi:hypothetical protein